MNTILIPLSVYRESNPFPEEWPSGRISRTATLVQRRVERDLSNAGRPCLSLSRSPRYSRKGGQLLPISTWELAARIELGRRGYPGHTAVRPPRLWIPAETYAETFKHVQSLHYLNRVKSRASRLDPKPMGPYGTRRHEVWEESFRAIEV